MGKRKKRGPVKPHGMNLAQAKAYEKQVHNETVHAEAYALLQLQSDHLLQQVMDAAFMAANDVFHMGPGRCVEFGNTTLRYMREIAELINSDFDEDPDLVYSREKIDQKLHKICGENFEPWEVRYGGKCVLGEAAEAAGGEKASAEYGGDI